MAKMRKVLAVTMAAAMTMSMLAGCGDKKTDGTEEQTVQSTETESGGCVHGDRGDRDI